MSSSLSSSSTSSRSRSTSSNTGTDTPTSTSSIPVVTTPLTATPLPSGGGGGGGGDNGGGGGGNFNNNPASIASSASLYLYTFLATLVLLLSVSAAIVIRSFLLRRRHRRMIEEAIRNGTWVPPTTGPGGRGGNSKVDLSKKPIMWEAYLDLQNTKGSLHGTGDTNNNNNSAGYTLQRRQTEESEWEWDGIKPLMASYLTHPPPGLSVKEGAGGGGGAHAGGNSGGNSSSGNGDLGRRDGNGNNTLDINNPNRTSPSSSSAVYGLGAAVVTSSRQLVGNVTRRVRNVLRRTDGQPSTPSGMALPVTNGTANNTRQDSAGNVSSTTTSGAGGQDMVPMTELEPLQPTKMQVAVLITMPRPHPPSSSSSLPLAHQQQPMSPSSALSQPASSIPFLTPPPHSHTNPPPPISPTPEEEEELPHLEMGVAELVLSISPDSRYPHFTTGTVPEWKGKARESIGSSTSL